MNWCSHIMLMYELQHINKISFTITLCCWETTCNKREKSSHMRTANTIVVQLKTYKCRHYPWQMHCFRCQTYLLLDQHKSKGKITVLQTKDTSWISHWQQKKKHSEIPMYAIYTYQCNYLCLSDIRLRLSDVHPFWCRKDGHPLSNKCVLCCVRIHFRHSFNVTQRPQRQAKFNFPKLKQRVRMLFENECCRKLNGIFKHLFNRATDYMCMYFWLFVICVHQPPSSTLCNDPFICSGNVEILNTYINLD